MTIDQISHPTLLPRFSRLLSRRIGLHFPQERWPDLMRGMRAAAREFNFADAAECMQWLLSAPLKQNQIEILATHLTIGETYFFREPLVFEALQTQILPALIESRRQSGRRLRIWSAACSTGEEAYSIAILIQRLIPDHKQWNITILGTDVNPHALRKAASGIYGDWSFRNAPPWLRERYFQFLGGGRYQIAPQIQDMVTFSYLNLAEVVSPPLANHANAMDIIFCRNVLMYFEPGLAAKVVRQHCQSLLDGGWLIVSPAEVSPALFAQLETVNFPGASLHRKNLTRFAWNVAMASSGSTEITDVGKTDAAAKTWPSRPEPAYSTTLKAQSKQPAPTYRQALDLYRQGLYKEAAEHVGKLIADRNDPAQAMSLMVRIHANQGQLAAALYWCERSIAADRIDPTGHYLMAVILMEQGEMEAAKLALKRTLYLDQDFVLAHFTLANLYSSQSRHKEAGKYFANTLSLLKGYPLEEVLPESEGITAGRLTEIIRSIPGMMAT